MKQNKIIVFKFANLIKGTVNDELRISDPTPIRTINEMKDKNMVDTYLTVMMIMTIIQTSL